MHGRSVSVFCVALVLSGFFLLGCEDKPETENVSSYFDERDFSLDETTPTRRAELVVSPSGPVTVSKDGNKQAFSVDGAVSRVTWSVENPARGRIVTQSGASAVYERLSEGDNVVIVSDTAAGTAFTVVRQPPEVEPEPEP